MPPQPESAASAVTTLRAELASLNDSTEGIDRKAAAVPAVLGVIAGVLVAPDLRPSPVQAVVLLSALAVGAVSVAYALSAFRARLMNIGPNADQVAAGTHHAVADFDHAVAGSLARAVNDVTKVTRLKGHRLNWSLGTAAVAVLLMAAARVIGGMGW